MSERCFVRTVTEYEVTADIDSISLTAEGEKKIITQEVIIMTNTPNPEKIEREIQKKYNFNNTGKTVFIKRIIKISTPYKIKESDFFEYAKAGEVVEQVVYMTPVGLEVTYMAQGGLENE